MSDTRWQKRDVILVLGSCLLVLGLLMVSPWTMVALLGALLIVVWWLVS